MEILVADDELVSREKMARLIEGLGHSPLRASNGAEALDIWKKKRPNMVITDWIMPEMNGLELVKEIRNQQGSRYTYIIMVTSQESTDNVVTGINAGADDYIVKPFVREEVAVRVGAGMRVINFETRDMVIFSMANLAEARDPETGNHLERIRHYSRILAERLCVQGHPEIDPLFVDNVFMTSPLHDIGKIGIPDFVLLKPGRFDDREFDIMKQHCVIGAESLRKALAKFPNAEYLKMSAEIALNHHEKYNGTGYPHGIAGDQIPISARIVALADVYDALVSKRVYKAAMPHETARSIITEERGKHFDPLIVDTFFACEDKFIAILEEYTVSGS